MSEGALLTDQQDHAAQNPRKWEVVARREERQLYGNTKLIPPSDLVLLPPPRSLLWGQSLESAGRGTDGRWASLSLQLDTGCTDTVRPGRTESHLIPSNVSEAGAESAEAQAIS